MFIVKAVKVAVLVVVAAAASGCSGAPGQPGPVGSARPTASAKVPSAPLPGAEWAAARWVEYDSLAHGLSMPLPPDITWRVEDAKEGWLLARHAAAMTTVGVRWIATDGLANRARCETRARDLGALPDRARATVMDRRRVDLPSGFDTILEVGLLSAEPGKPITGYALAIGGWSKRCFVYVLTTTAQGRGSEEAVADRLALFVERSFLRLRFESDLTPPVPRERPPL